MAKPYRIQEVEREHNAPIEQIIPDLLNKFGTQKAVADHLGLSQATISMWLKENGYVQKVIYVRLEDFQKGYINAQ